MAKTQVNLGQIAYALRIERETEEGRLLRF